MKKYNGIIKGFTKTIKKLENLAEDNVVKVEKNDNDIAYLKNQNSSFNAESIIAASTARKLSELIGG